MGWDGVGVSVMASQSRARHLLAHMLDHLPAARLAFEGFRHDVVELAQTLAAAFIAGARGRVGDALDRQIRPNGRAGA